MNISMQITDLSPEENLLISKFIDLLSKSTKMMPELTREPTGKIYVMYPDARDKVERIKEILEEI
jgi:hypothetical protein